VKWRGGEKVRGSPGSSDPPGCRGARIVSGTEQCLVLYTDRVVSIISITAGGLRYDAVDAADHGRLLAL